MPKKGPDILATITDEFELSWSVPKLLQLHLQQIGAGSKVRVDIRKWYRKRTLKQNATAWGLDYAVIRAFLAEAEGKIFSDDEIHDFHKKKFLGYTKSDLATGLLITKSTTDLDTVEFMHFREKYCRFWAELGCYIPDPDPEKGED